MRVTVTEKIYNCKTSLIQTVRKVIVNNTTNYGYTMYNHVHDFNNPHQVTKAQVGLSEADNTSDLDKPISTATQAALDLKEDLINKSTDVNLGTSDTLYPTQNAVKVYVDTITDDLREDLEAEIERATTAEELIQSNLDAEILRATTAEGVLQDNIDATNDALDAEVLRATTAEEQLQEDLNAEIDRAIAAELDLENSKFDNPTGTTEQYLNGLGVPTDFLTYRPETVKAAEPILKGQAVYISGANGTNILVKKASNLTEATSSKTFGIATQDFATNDIGVVAVNGLFAGFDTTAGTVGDPIWLGENGNLIYGLINKPYAPKHLVYIGVLSRRNSNNGEIYINIQNGFELDELHDVLIVDKQNKDGLFYNSTSSLWENKTIEENLGYTPANEATTITINGETYDLSENREWTVGGDVRSVQSFISTDGQSEFTLNYTVGQLDVFLNGAKLYSSEYIATNGTSVSIIGGTEEADVVEFVVWATTASLTGTMTIATSGFGEAIQYDPIANLLTINKFSWKDLVRGWSVKPVKLLDNATQKVYRYEYLGGTIYFRSIMKDLSEDAFYASYTGGVLSSLLCIKRITI